MVWEVMVVGVEGLSRRLRVLVWRLGQLVLGMCKMGGLLDTCMYDAASVLDGWVKLIFSLLEVYFKVTVPSASQVPLL